MLPEQIKTAEKSEKRWLVLTGLATAIFVIWLIAGGYRWEGYPCFAWQVGLGWRTLYFLAFLALVVWFCHQLYLVVREPIRFTPRAIVLALITFTFLRIILATGLPLLADEAYHWLWADKIDWCYYDHPGVLGWVSFPFRVVSESVLAARLGPILMGTVTVILAWRFTHWLTGSQEAANICLAGMMMLPLGLVGTTILFTDTPLAIFWLAAIWVTLVALRRKSNFWWVLLGVFWGLSLNCKFLGVPLIGLLCVYLLIDPAGRRALRSPGPYLAVLAMIVVFLPTIFWNMFNGWQTFYFHFVAREPVSGLYPSGLLAYLDRQIMLVGPVWLVWCLAVPAFWGYRKYRQGKVEAVALVLPAYVPFMMYVILRIFRPPEAGGGNWTAPLYAVMMIILAWSAIENGHARRWLRFSMWAGAVTTCLLVGVVIGQVFIGPDAIKALSGTFLSEKKVERFLRAYFAWYPVGKELDELFPRYNHDRTTFVMARNYAQAANLTEYSRYVPLVLSFGNDTIFGQCFTYWNAPESHLGQDCLYISDHVPSKHILDILRQCFSSVEELGPSDRRTDSTVAKDFRIYYCRDMKRFPQAKMEATTRLR
jgi:hypothetical protein